ncbi:MAG: HD-GYP domain-containing protein [Candidatus Xenobiia bacterium LiM19]
MKSAENSHQISQTSVSPPLSKETKKTSKSDAIIADASTVSAREAETAYKAGTFSTHWLKETSTVINNESEKNNLLNILNEISSNTISSEAVIRDFVSATTTSDGIIALGKLLDSAGNNANLSTTLCKIRAEASQSSEGITALKHLNSAASRNTDLAASLMKVMAIAAKSSEGLKYISTYGQAISNAPEISASDIALRNQAVKNPEGAINTVNYNVSLASHSESAAVDMSIYSAAAQNYEGINHIIAYNNSAMRNQALSISEINKYATAAQTSHGIRNITKYLYYTSRNSSASSSEIGKSAIAADNNTGLKVLINYNNWTSTDPMLASMELAKYASALNLPEGLSTIERLNDLLSTNSDASTSEAAKYATALQTPYGVKSLTELNNGLSRSAGASASEIRKRVTAIENTDGGKHIETLYRELGKNKSTLSSETKLRAAAVLVPQGLEKFKTYSKFLKSPKTSESHIATLPQRPKETAISSVTTAPQATKEAVRTVSSSSSPQSSSEGLTGKEAAAQTLAAMSLDLEPDAAISSEPAYSEKIYVEEQSSGRDAALKTLEAINAVLGDENDDMPELSSAYQYDEDEISVWKEADSQYQYNATEPGSTSVKANQEAALKANQDTAGAIQQALKANQVDKTANQKAVQIDLEAVQVNKVENFQGKDESALKASAAKPAQISDALHSNVSSTAATENKDTGTIQAISSIPQEIDLTDNPSEQIKTIGSPISPESINTGSSPHKEAQISAPESLSEQFTSSDNTTTSIQRTGSSTAIDSISEPLPYVESETGNWLINEYLEVLNDNYEEWSFAIQEINPENSNDSVEQKPAESYSTEVKNHSISEHHDYLIADTIQDGDKRFISLLSKPLTEEALQLIAVYVSNSMTEEQKGLFMSIINQKITDEKRDMVMHLLVNPLAHDERRIISLLLSKNPKPESRELLTRYLTLDFTKEQRQTLTNHLMKPAFQDQRKALNQLISQNLSSSQKQWLISLFSRPLSEEMRQLIIRLLTHPVSRENREVILSILSRSFSGEARNFLLSLISQPLSQEQRQLLFLLINKNLTAEQKHNLITILAGKVSAERVRQVILSFTDSGTGDGLTVRPGLLSGDSADESGKKKKDASMNKGKQRLSSSLSHLNPEGEDTGIILCSSLFPDNQYRKKDDVSIISTKAMKKDIVTVKGFTVEPRLLKNESITLQRAGMAGKEIKERAAKAVSDAPKRNEKLDNIKNEMEYESQRKEIYLREPDRVIPYKKAEEQPSLKAQLLDKKQETKPDRQLQDRDYGEEYIKYTHEHEDSFKTFKMESRVYQFVSYICEDILKKKFGLHDFKKEYFTQYMCFLLRTSGDFTFSHSLRTQSLSLNLAKRAGIKDRTVLEQLRLGALFVDIGEMEYVFNDAPESKLDAIKGFLSDQDLLLAGVLHDIGKIKIPDSILYKPGKLSGEEFKVMRMHPIYSAMMLYPIQPLRHLCPVVRAHHEKWDGKGYPDGLAEENIPVASRIIAIADVFDALISDRPYKKGMPWPKVKKIMLEGRGTHFDPDLLDIFMEYVTPLYEV